MPERSPVQICRILLAAPDTCVVDGLQDESRIVAPLKFMDSLTTALPVSLIINLDEAFRHDAIV